MQMLIQLFKSDALSIGVALTMMAMSIASWVTIFYKTRMLWRARFVTEQAVECVWQSPDLPHALTTLQTQDTKGWVVDMLAGALNAQNKSNHTLERALRNALQNNTRQLQSGQLLLATVASTAPFVGLLGTVWGIFHALRDIGGTGQVNIGQLATPVGEALVMTAAGLLVALPAVLAHNVFSRLAGQTEMHLEGFADDVFDALTADATFMAIQQQQTTDSGSGSTT